MIFVDSNVPMYLVGAPHPNKELAGRAISQLIERGERLVTDAEVLQEILQRYSAIRRLDAVHPAFAVLLAVVDEVFPVERSDAEDASSVLLGFRGEMSARDALHAAIMRRHGASHVLSFDRGFDRVPWLTRVPG